MRLVDKDTPASARTWTSPAGIKHNVVFSDEFETPGRTFYPGDDPFVSELAAAASRAITDSQFAQWEAVDIWYGATKNLEW